MCEKLSDKKLYDKIYDIEKIYDIGQRVYFIENTDEGSFVRCICGEIVYVDAPKSLQIKNDCFDIEIEYGIKPIDHEGYSKCNYYNIRHSDIFTDLRSAFTDFLIKQQQMISLNDKDKKTGDER